MTGGVITGGWEYVWAVYGLSFVVYVTYTASVLVRWSREWKRSRPAQGERVMRRPRSGVDA